MRSRRRTRGSHLTTPPPGEIDVMTCSLDNLDAFPPRFHVSAGERPAWVQCDDGLPTFARTQEG